METQQPIKELMPTPLVSCSLKRKRPPRIEIPNVLQEIYADKLKVSDFRPKDEPFCFSENGVGVCCAKGKKKFMEDTHKIVSCLNGRKDEGFFGVYDGHGGHRAAEFVAENLHFNILEMMENCNAKEEAVKAGYLKTDQEFLKQGIVSGTCCVTALIEGQEVVVSNLGDCRAVLSRGGVAEALTKDHRAEREDERKRIENKGGFVDIHRGSWRVHGILSVSRSIGDAHLKDWVVAEPDTRILPLTSDMEFLILASDGLWDEVGNQEAIDTVVRLCMPEKKSSFPDFQKDDNFCYGCVNVSPSSKLKRVSLVKRERPKLSPRDTKTTDTRKDISSENESPSLALPKVAKDHFPSENGSPPSKLRRVSLFKRVNAESGLLKPEKSVDKKIDGSVGAGLVGACKELVKLAVSRGSMDDITVMIIDLTHFRCKI